MNIEYPVALDGGLSNQLESMGMDLGNPLWTADLLCSDPEAVIQAHLAYLEAGAQIILTASYQATLPGFMNIGFSEQEAMKLISHSVDLAREAVNRFSKSQPDGPLPFVGASIGPYGAFLADGSEYRGEYSIDDKELHEFHQSRVEILNASLCDFLAIETLPSFQEALVLSELIESCSKEAWISFSCCDESNINDGTPITQCVELINPNPRVFAVGINCTHPKYISPLIRKIKEVLVPGKQIVVYPNSGELYAFGSKSWIGSPDSRGFDSPQVQEWLDAGADIIGGCCRVGPAQIQEIAQVLKNHTH